MWWYRVYNRQAQLKKDHRALPGVRLCRHGEAVAAAAAAKEVAVAEEGLKLTG
jgi:hypothetical protein